MPPAGAFCSYGGWHLLDLSFGVILTQKIPVDEAHNTAGVEAQIEKRSQEEQLHHSSDVVKSTKCVAFRRCVGACGLNDSRRRIARNGVPGYRTFFGSWHACFEMQARTKMTV